MNKLKKTLVLVCCAALLVCISVGATVAYLTSQTQVVNNTFSVGDVVIDLDEAKVDLYGKEVEGAARVKANQYKLLPGHTYIKDPTVHVEPESEESYIRMFVTITDMTDVKAVLGANFLPEYFVTGWDKDVWVSTGVVAEYDNTATYEFRYHEKVDHTLGAEQPLVLEPLFEEIVIPGTITNTNLTKLSDMKIKVIAQAIQADGFVETKDDDGNVTATAIDNAWIGYGETIYQVAEKMATAQIEGA